MDGLVSAGGRRLGLRFKFIVLISLLFVVSGAVLCWFFISKTRKTFEEELLRRGVSLAKNLAYNSPYGVSIEDTGVLGRFVKGISDEPDVAYVIIMGREGQVLAHSDEGEVGRTYHDAVTTAALRFAQPEIQSTRDATGRLIHDVGAPVVSKALAGGAEERIGLVRVGLSTDSLEERLSALLRVGGLISAAVIGVGIGVTMLLIRIIVRPIEQMARAAVKITEGDFTHRIEVNANDEVGILAEAFGKMAENLSDMIKRMKETSSNVTLAGVKISESSQRVQNGAKIQADSTEKTVASIEQFNVSAKEIAESVDILSSSAEETSSSILEMTASIGEVANNAGGLATAVDDTTSSMIEMSASIKEVAENVEVLSSASDQTATAINQINSSLKEVEGHAKRSADLSARVTLDAKELGMRSIEKTIEGMNKIQETVVKSAEVINRLGQRSEEIGKILTVIDDVTKQTNLLSLNAAILAAQAGEQGKGFAVVADEIKGLAEKTATKTKEISGLITNVQNEAKDAVHSVREGAKSVEEGMRLSLEAGAALKKILESSDKSSEMAREIERATVEQAKGIRQVTEAMGRVSQMIQQIANATQEQSRGSEQIMQASERMREMTRQVKISSEEQAKGSRQITKAVETVTQRVQQIARAINEQKRGSDVITKAIEEIQTIAKVNVDSVEEMNTAIRTLSQQSLLLQDMIGKFKV